MTAISTGKEPRIALFSGSFRPFTIGHADIVERALALFDKVVIAVGINKSKPGDEASADHAVEAIGRLYAGESRVEVRTYSTLTVQFARSVGARFIVRGIRSVKDFEYERDMAQVNSQLSGIETVVLFSRPELSVVSSSLVRELKSFGEDVRPYLPQNNI